MKKKLVKFYAKEWSTGQRRIFTFEVFSEQRAAQVLKEYGVPSGYYSVWEHGREIVNKKIMAARQ